MNANVSLGIYTGYMNIYQASLGGIPLTINSDVPVRSINMYFENIFDTRYCNKFCTCHQLTVLLEKLYSSHVKIYNGETYIGRISTSKDVHKNLLRGLFKLEHLHLIDDNTIVVCKSKISNIDTVYKMSYVLSCILLDLATRK